MLNVFPNVVRLKQQLISGLFQVPIMHPINWYIVILDLHNFFAKRCITILWMTFVWTLDELATETARSNFVIFTIFHAKLVLFDLTSGKVEGQELILPPKNTKRNGDNDYQQYWHNYCHRYYGNVDWWRCTGSWRNENEINMQQLNGKKMG